MPSGSTSGPSGVAESPETAAGRRGQTADPGVGPETSGKAGAGPLGKAASAGTEATAAGGGGNVGDGGDVRSGGGGDDGDGGNVRCAGAEGTGGGAERGGWLWDDPRRQKTCLSRTIHGNNSFGDNE